MKNPSEFKKFALEIANYFPKILPATEVIQEAEKLAKDWLVTQDLGVSHKGHKIRLLSQTQPGKKNVLLYGFADPGEAVGGTGLLCLMKALKERHPFLEGLNVNWNFIPCLNLDDQPHGGTTLDKVMKTSEEEVDWMVERPRPETLALLKANQELKPAFTFPLHDEWHCHEQIPCYMPVSKNINPNICNGLREILMSFGLEISTEVNDSEMGPGFLNMQTVPDIQKSTFHQFSQNGFVFICEVPDISGKPDNQVIAAQLAAGLFALTHSL